MYLPTDRTWQSCRPLNDWVIAKAEARVTKTSGGIHLPDQIVAVERVMPVSARILRVGRTASKKVGITLEPGMRFCLRGFLKDAFHEFAEEDGLRVFMVKADDILAILDDDTIQVGSFVGTTVASLSDSIHTDETVSFKTAEVG